MLVPGYRLDQAQKMGMIVRIVGQRLVGMHSPRAEEAQFELLKIERVDLTSPTCSHKPVMAPTNSLIVKGSPLILLGLIAGCVQILEIDVLTPVAPDASVPDGGAMDPADASLPDAAASYDAIPPDASLAPAYEIAYVNDMIFDPSAGSLDIAGFIVVINAGTLALDLSTTRVQSFYDDSAQVGYTFSFGIDTATVLQPGEAAGELSPLATQSIIGTGLVSEPLVDTTYSFGMVLNNLPSEKLDVNAQAVLNIGGKNITLPFTIHLMPGADTTFTATRIQLAD